ncbi:MAG: toxin-antitoxin system YwqK family antitoxin [Planctomycetota bacterium]
MSSIRRKYYDDGTLASETQRKGEQLNGCQRRWHPNGVLAAEWFMKDDVPDGVGKQWNDKGELLGTYEIVNGTGIYRTWHENGQLAGEFPWVEGASSGRERLFSPQGDLLLQTYLIEGRKVSRKRYMEAAMADPRLPRYDEDEASRREVKQPGRSTATSKTEADRMDTDTVCLRLLEDPDAQEALSWLTEPDAPFRSLGEGTEQDESIQLVERLYTLGAVRVTVIEIDGGPNEEQNSGKLIIELPDEQTRRDSVMHVCDDIASDLGFDPETDTGQRYRFLGLD